MKIIQILLVITLMLSKSASAQKEISANKMHKVVMQLNTADTSAWSGVIGNIKNFQKIWPNQVMIEVVVHGKALNFLVKDKSHLKDDVFQLESDKIHFVACENTMNKYKIHKDMLIDKVGTVPSGVAEIVLKQEADWGYLKTGF